ncbi:Histone deacetylase complex subunit SAP30/SAP30-like [Trema orientale]|uniref:Histone deacetylase complex subunit SAP30/SAP30-like n=1 Tax=Trema orientale TaxID=63057 RepID=A0A2P5EG86_TREOI|nr:Histone deacetylase complex subunit SAP30/SAP30-like [Trema orientale]
MLEPELCSSRILSPLREESGDEELSVLPRHTKVIVTGNNRTKSVLVGLQGVVKKAVGLGGWHWLARVVNRGKNVVSFVVCAVIRIKIGTCEACNAVVLKNGVEVKLQRNALSVLEHPTGNEEGDDHDYDNSSTSSEIGEKDNDFYSSTEFHKHYKPRVRHSKSSAISTAKSIHRGIYKEVQSIHGSRSSLSMARLGIDSLKRYCRYFNLASNHSNPSREDLINIVQRHFDSQQKPLDDIPVVTEFVQAAAKRRKQAFFPEKYREQEF